MFPYTSRLTKMGGQHENYRPRTRKELVDMQSSALDSFDGLVHNAVRFKRFTPEQATVLGIAIVRSQLRVVQANAGLAGCDVFYDRKNRIHAIELINKGLILQTILERSDRGYYSLLGRYFTQEAEKYSKTSRDAAIRDVRRYYQRISNTCQQIAEALPKSET